MRILKPYLAILLSVGILLPQQQSISQTEELDIDKIEQKAKADAKTDFYKKSTKIKVKGMRLPTDRIMELSLQNEQYRSVYLSVYKSETKRRHTTNCILVLVVVVVFLGFIAANSWDNSGSPLGNAPLF